MARVADLVLLTDGARWVEILPLVKRIIAKGWSGKFEPEDIYDACAKGDFQCWAWIVNDKALGVLLTRITAYPRAKVIELLGLAGPDRRDWLHELARIEAWAISQGCTMEEASGRSGWEEVMAPHGFRKTAVMISKELRHA